MKNIMLNLILLFSFNLLVGQTFCHTPSKSNNLKLNSSLQLKSTNNDTYCIKIYFHVIRRSNGTGGQSNGSVNEAFNILNQDFNTHDIFFNWDNQIDYIDNDRYYNSPSVGIFDINNHKDGIDIYLFDDSSSSGGRANGVGQSSEFWVSGSYWKSPNNSLAKSHVISHEMGHVLYLWHTHHGTFDEGGNDDNQCKELVNGSNSFKCGDYVVDTPADPYLDFDVNQTTCEWNSSATDANGHTYNPDEKNIMSYTDINCMDYFTPKQGQRMRNAISTLSHLKKTITKNCTRQELSPIDQLCYSSSKTLAISNIQNNTTVWEVSSNVLIVSSNNSSITLKPKYASSSGNGWVRATLSNGVVLQEDFSITNGKASVKIILEPMGTNYVALEMVGANGTNIKSLGITNTSWQKLSSGGGCYASFGGSGFSGLAHGSCNNWRIYAKITATSPCGTTTIYKTITPPPPPPPKSCSSYSIAAMGYAAYRIIIGPCDNGGWSHYTSNTESYPLSDGKAQIWVYNYYGDLVLKTNKSDFSLANQRKGIYFAKAYVDDKVLIKKVLR